MSFVAVCKNSFGSVRQKKQYRMKTRIVNEIQEVLTPTKRSLEKEIDAIHKKDIFWHQQGEKERFGISWYQQGEKERFENLFKIYSDSKAFNDTFKQSHDLEKMVQSHDTLYDELDRLYSEIEREISTHEFRTCIKTLLDKFNQSRVTPYRLTWDYFEAETIFESYIINKRTLKRSLNTIEPPIDFWAKYKDELMAFRDTYRVMVLDKEIENKISQLEASDKQILQTIAEKVEKYRVKYQLTEDDINSELQELKESSLCDRGDIEISATYQ
jgi:hypothetical protein